MIAQSGSWVRTGAAGCEGIVPAAVPAGRSFTEPGTYCFNGDPAVDGAGNLVWIDSDASRVFFPVDGTPKSVRGVTLVATRSRGFVRGVIGGGFDWVVAVAPDGTDEGLLHAPRKNPQCDDSVFSADALIHDPRGGYVETRKRAELVDSGDGFAHFFDVRWMDETLLPRTPWIQVATWSYSYNVAAVPHVSVSGDVFVTLFFDPPMSMPCAGALTRAFWASEDGSVVAATPVTPTMDSPACDDPQFAGFGSAVVVGDAVAFHHDPGTSTDGLNKPSQTGWYAQYPARSTAAEQPPAWLVAYDGSVARLANGTYLATRRGEGTCARTAELIGRGGQLCATLSLDGSEGCAARDQIWPDGTLVLHEQSSCSFRWWPLLGGAR